MTNEEAGDNPSADPNADSTKPTPMIPTTPLKSTLPNDGKGNPDNKKQEADELAREFRIAEKWVIGTNIILAIVGIVALCIYKGQLNVMGGQLAQMKTSSEQSGKQTDDLISAANIQACAATKVADASTKNALAADRFAKSAQQINEQAKLSVEVMRGMVKEIQTSNQQAKDALYIQIRPWVGFDLDSMTVESKCYDPPRAHALEGLIMKGKLLNYGRTPALRVAAEFAVRSEQTMNMKKFPVDNEEMGQYIYVCDSADARINNRTARDSIFPGSRPYTINVTGTGGFKSDYHFIVGCIAYQDVSGGTVYHTRMRYDISIPYVCEPSPPTWELMYAQAQEVEELKTKHK